MADIFGDVEPATVEESTEAAVVEDELAVEDPAAEFLAQQQDEIAGLENDVLGGEVTEDTVVTNGFNNDDDEQVEQAVKADADFFAAAPEEPITNGEEAEAEEEEIMDPSQAYAAIAAASARIDQLKGEPEKIRLWREQNNQLLAEKDAESEKQKEIWLAQAKKELEDWDKNRAEQLEKIRESNRATEEEFIKERDNTTPGSEWDRVSRLCDFNPKATKGSKDVSRMRSSLLHLKQNPRPISVPMAANSQE